MRQIHEMKQSTLAMSTLYLGAFGIVAGGSMAFSTGNLAWLVLTVLGAASFAYGTVVRKKDLRVAFVAYLQDVDLDDLRNAQIKKQIDEKSLALVDKEIRRRRKANLP